MPRLPLHTPDGYPDHLREQFIRLPSAPGVYLFYGEQQRMPLYIGKSINIRSRVLAHARTLKAARLLRQTRRIEYHLTAGDLGAQLLEAQLIKQLQPLYNRRLRQQRPLYTLRLRADAPPLIDLSTLTLQQDIRTVCYGLFSNRRAAIASLETIADEHGLCLQRLGIAAWPTLGPCFRVAIKRCRGVCCGQEQAEIHDARLQHALAHWRIHTWPYAGPIGLIESSPTLRQIHVVHQWQYLGSAATACQAQRLTTTVAGFDRDIYRILCPALFTATYPVVPLTCLP